MRSTRAFHSQQTGISSQGECTCPDQSRITETRQTQTRQWGGHDWFEFGRLRGSPPESSRCSLVGQPIVLQFPLHDKQPCAQSSFPISGCDLKFQPLSFDNCLIITLVSARALDAQTSRSAPTVPGRYTPAAEPKAVTIHGNARFTVLTPQLIRMEWAADGKFEDHASRIFLNRRLPAASRRATHPLPRSAVPGHNKSEGTRQATKPARTDGISEGSTSIRILKW